MPIHECSECSLVFRAKQQVRITCSIPCARKRRTRLRNESGLGMTVAEKRLYVVNKKTGVPCQDCGVVYPYYVMQFDHVRGVKLFGLNTGYARTKEEIDEELEKCEVVCANCHAIRTWERSQSEHR